MSRRSHAKTRCSETSDATGALNEMAEETNYAIGVEKFSYRGQDLDLDPTPSEGECLKT